MTVSAPPYRVSLRLYVVFSVLMAGSAASSGLLLLYLARPFVGDLPAPQAWRITVLLFSGAALAGAVAAVAGLIVGVRFAGRIRGIVERAEALAPGAPPAPQQTVRDELGALDAAMGRLSLSMDRFIRDSDILSRLPEGMLLLGPGGNLVSSNTTAETVLGLSLGRFQGMLALSPEGPFPLGKGNEALAQVLEDAKYGDGSIHVSEVAVTTTTGQSLLLEITAQRREWSRSMPVVVLVFRDASEKRRIREEIRRADQLAFLGGMAARVAHEIRTPLATIRGLLELLQADLPEEDSRRQYIDRVLQGVERQNRLVENLLTLSHPEPETLQAVSVAALIEDVVGMPPRDARLSVHLGDPASLPAVSGDPFRLGEVFSNLIENALQASPESGTVHVRVETAGPERVRVRVRNTGAGVPAELRERIFQPFFTTKTRGTGLGLAIARQIVEAHRGSIRVESDGHSETTFIVELPTTTPVLAAGSA